MKKVTAVLVLIAAVFMIFSFAGCSGSQEVKLEDTKWTLDSLGAKDNPQPVIEGTTVTARIQTSPAAQDVTRISVDTTLTTGFRLECSAVPKCTAWTRKESWTRNRLISRRLEKLKATR